MEYYYEGYKNMNLWIELENRSNLSHEKELMKDIIDMAAQKLDKITEVFPTYTLHSTKHSENVIKNMENFLGDNIHLLSDVELIILILSAYMHDVGMYYNNDEINTIRDSDEFIDYLDKYPSEYLKYKNSPILLSDVINGYCRCYHARRVNKFVAEINEKNKGISLKSIDILDKVAAVCESHNDNVLSIINNNTLNTRLGYVSDMKFCAIILRLADYVDFDGSRTPEYMYEFLDIKNRDKNCVDNWKRHLNSGGFYFDMEDGNVLGYCAEPDEPYVEYTIRCFIDEIERELKECKDILQICNDKWRNFKLPYIIDRKQIKSQGYDYGEYVFTLKKEKILELFMGEQLYTDKFVFIREIMQNAIDTSCFRKFWEESRGAEYFEVPAIEIYDWIDEYANHYVRINDYGMGMNIKIIKNYFLKIGESYYRSDEFNAEKMKMKDNGINSRNFQPISQFGIGFLSCFLVCDSIEIYTSYRSIDNSSSDIIRLSIKGVEDFYTMRLNNRAGGLLNKPGYSERKETYGTSIVFRLNPTLYDGNFDLEEIVKQYVFCPPISITINEKKLEYMNDKFIHQKLFDVEEMIEITEETNPDCIYCIKKWSDKKVIPKLFLRKIPCDLTELSPSANLMGQGVFFYFDTESPIKLNDGLFQRSYSFYVQYGKICVSLSKVANQNEIDKLEKKLEALLNILKIILKQIRSSNYYISASYLNTLLSYHNKLKELWQESYNPQFNSSLDLICDFFNDMNDKVQNKLKKQTGYGANKECQKLLSESISYADKIRNEITKIKELDINEYNFFIDLGKVFMDLYDLQTKRNYFLSYNGIIIPKQQSSKRIYYKHMNRTSLKFGIMPIIIALKNDLRPQLSLSRNYICTMKWNIDTNINITIKKFFQNIHIYETTEPFKLLSDHPTYKDVLEDRYVKNEWKDFKIIKTDLGVLSFYDIRDKLNSGRSIILKSVYRLYHDRKADFFTVCSYTLTQLGFEVQMKIGNNQLYEGNCNVNLLENESCRYNESYYAPLFFADFEKIKYNHILCFQNSPLNRKHPFSIWLLSVTPDLFRNYRSFFNAIIICFENFSFENGKQIAERLNNILHRLREVAPELKIDRNLIVNYNHHMLI